MAGGKYTVIVLQLVFVSLSFGATIRGTDDIDDKHERKVRSVGDPFDVDVYLERYGYLKRSPAKGPNDDKDPEDIPSHSEEERSHAIRQFQEFAGLKATGRMNRETAKKMMQPRCGFPDIQEGEVDPNKPSDFTAIGLAWKDKEVTWKPHSFTRKLPRTQQWSAFDKAFKRWEEVSGLTFMPVEENADININFGRGHHGDEYPFDGPGQTLAHAFLPDDGRVHFDDDEDWVFNEEGTELETVAAHEFGHALGLSHSRVRGSLMAPFYNGYNPDFTLHQDDMDGIQYLYGRPEVPTTTKPTPEETTIASDDTTTAKPIDGRICNISYDAITEGPDGYTYMFYDEVVFKLKTNCGSDTHGCIEQGYPKFIRDVFPGGPRRLLAATYVPSSRQIYLFKHRSIWRYTDFTLDEGYPKYLNIKQMPAKPNAALTYRTIYNTYQIYLFGEGKFWEHNQYTDEASPGYPLSIATYWPGVPKRPDAALQDEEGFIYFFKDSRYRKYEGHHRSLIAGYQNGKEQSPAWIGGQCGAAPK